MITVQCDCGSQYTVAVTPVHCRCGKKCGNAMSVKPLKSVANRLARCVHLGPQIGTADCDCETKPRAYACGLHGLCLPRMSVTAAAVAMDDGTRATVRRCCARCEDHTPATIAKA